MGWYSAANGIWDDCWNQTPSAKPQGKMLFSTFINTGWHRQKPCSAPMYFKLYKCRIQVFCLLTLGGRQKWKSTSLFSELEYWKINLQLEWTFTGSSQSNKKEDHCTQIQNIMLLIASILIVCIGYFLQPFIWLWVLVQILYIIKWNISTLFPYCFFISVTSLQCFAFVKEELKVLEA